MDKKQYIESINELLEKTNDSYLMHYIYKLLLKAQ